MKHARMHLINAMYFMAIIIISLVVSVIGLTRKINLYRATDTQIEFSVHRDEVNITSASSGTVTKIHVQPGDQVKAGDLVVELTNSLVQAELATLDSFSDVNLSARTQAELLRAQAKAYQIIAPRDGYVASINVTEGSLINANDAVLKMYAGDDITLESKLYTHQIETIQRHPEVKAYSYRLERHFIARYVNINEVEDVGDTDQYTVRFSLDEQDAGELLQGETLVVLSFDDSMKSTRPADIIADGVNQLLLGSTIN